MISATRDRRIRLGELALGRYIPEPIIAGSAKPLGALLIRYPSQRELFSLEGVARSLLRGTNEGSGPTAGFRAVPLWDLGAKTQKC